MSRRTTGAIIRELCQLAAELSEQRIAIPGGEAGQLLAELQTLVPKDSGYRVCWGLPPRTGLSQFDKTTCEQRPSEFLTLVPSWLLGRPSLRRVAIVSSRIGRDLLRQRPWFDVLREVVASLQTQSVLTVVADGAAGSRAIQTAAELYRLQTLVLQTTKPRERDVPRWFQQCLEAISQPSTDANRNARLFVSPVLVDSENNYALVSPRTSGVSTIPLRDRLPWDFCDELHVLSIRKNGTQHQLCNAYQRRHLESGGPQVYVWLAPRSLTNDALTSSAIRVRATNGKTTTPTETPVPADHLDEAAPVRIDPTSWPVENDPTDFLYHWTRRCDGPWPGESEATFVGRLLENEPGCHHTALDTLLRIVLERTIRGSTAAIRGDQAMVCFTEVSISEWHRLRAFRKHRTRWDFQPYGLAVSKEWLRSLGARPVIYGDAPDWEQLPEEQRPYFQRRVSGRGSSLIDWTVEREWRIPGDVYLPLAARLFVFAPGYREVAALREVSPWEVYLLQTESETE